MHTMTLAEEYREGVCEFYCPQCGKRFIVQFTPYKKIDLVIGDESVRHVGGVGGVKVGEVGINRKELWEILFGNPGKE